MQLVGASNGCEHLYPSTQETEAGWISEFKDSLVYIVSSRTARATSETLSQKHKTKISLFLFPELTMTQNILPSAFCAY